mmetsp:Transcript_5286/g.19871  ORF Transcript_5286/g.19871 Transcript_5286/m.19871 type:complete len:454 (-) Transcript_5286:714-2075(-)
MAAQRRRHGVAVGLVAGADRRNVCLQEAVADHLVHHALVEARRVQVGRLLGLQQLRIQLRRSDQIAQAETGRQHLGERAEVERTLGPQAGQRRGRRLVEPQVAVGVVLDDRHTHAAGGFDNGLATGGTHHPPGRVLVIRQQVGEPGARRVMRQRSQGLRKRALRIAGQAGEQWLVGREGLQGAEVGGGLDRHRGARIAQHLADEVQALLRAACDQHLLGLDLHAQACHALRHPVPQRREALAGGILQGLARVLAQHPVAGRLQRIDREGVGARQAPGHGQDPRLLGDLEDLANDGRVHPRGAAGLGPDGAHGDYTGFQNDQPSIRGAARAAGACTGLASGRGVARPPNSCRHRDHAPAPRRLCGALPHGRRQQQLKLGLRPPLDHDLCASGHREALASLQPVVVGGARHRQPQPAARHDEASCRARGSHGQRLARHQSRGEFISHADLPDPSF